MKKALDITKKVLVGLVVAVAVFMMIFTVISVTTFNRKRLMEMKAAFLSKRY